MTATSDRLACTLEVTVGTGQPHKFAPGNVRGFELRLSSYGLEGSVEVAVEDQSKSGGKADGFLADFAKPDLMAVSLSVESVQTDMELKGSREPLQVGGLVVRKSLVGHAFREVKGEPVLERIYRLELVDPARLLWGQHHPCELFTNKSMQNVLDTYKGKLTLKYDWDDLTTQAPMLFVGLDPTQTKASFYDFVVWYVDTYHGLFTYDQATQAYTFAAKQASAGTPIKISSDEVAAVTALFPEVPRHQPSVLNSWTEGASKNPVTAAQAATGVRQDLLLRTPITDDVSGRVTVETARLQIPQMRLELQFKRFPTLPFTPQAQVTLETPAYWTASASSSSESYRVAEMRLVARATRSASTEDYDAPNALYDLDFRCDLELPAEGTVHLPPYVQPPLVVNVEGKIVSEGGADTDDTYQVYTDSKTKLDQYKVEIPLWASQQITAPFEPLLAPGHFYFPAYKHERVLVGLEFQRATILRFLDWRAGAKLPTDGQGDHLLLGKSTTSNTSIRHYYDSNKPVFLMLRTNDKDTGTLQIQEGSLMLLVKENSGD